MNDWQTQTKKQPLFTDLDFAPPEQKSRAGSIALIGGSSGSFRTVAQTAETLEQLGVSKLHILLPDSLKKTLPSTPNITFAPAEPSGGFSKSAEPLLQSAAADTDATIIIGDLGKNSTTAIAISSVVKNTTSPTLITRDAIDLIVPEAHSWISNSAHITLLLTLPQLQKLFRTIYYPRVITLSQPTNQLIETLHKFTITHPITIATTHNDQYITSSAGQVTTTPLSDTTYSPLSIWQGDLAAKIAVHTIRQPAQPLASATTAILA